MGLAEAPTYWPSEKEWTDPLGYIQSIAQEGKKYGIIKVSLYISP
jgi:histone demethylase JARID1